MPVFCYGNGFLQLKVKWFKARVFGRTLAGNFSVVFYALGRSGCGQVARTITLLPRSNWSGLRFVEDAERCTNSSGLSGNRGTRSSPLLVADC